MTLKIMKIDKVLDNGQLTITVTGRLDTTTAPQLEDEIPKSGITSVVFDFSPLEYISSAGLRILLTTQKQMSACGGTMKITGTNAMVKGVFDMTGCSDIFDIVEA